MSVCGPRSQWMAYPPGTPGVPTAVLTLFLVSLLQPDWTWCGICFLVGACAHAVWGKCLSLSSPVPSPFNLHLKCHLSCKAFFFF